MFWLFGFFLHKMHTSEMSLGAKVFALLFFPYSLVLAAFRPAKDWESQQMDRYLVSHPVEAYRQLLRTPKHFLQFMVNLLTGTKASPEEGMLGYKSYMERIYQSLSDEEKTVWKRNHPEMDRSESEVRQQSEGSAESVMESESVKEGPAESVVNRAVAPEESGVTEEVESAELSSLEKEIGQVFQGFSVAGQYVELKGFFNPDGEIVVGVPPERMNTIEAGVRANSELTAAGVSVRLVPVQDLESYRRKAEDPSGEHVRVSAGVSRDFSLFYNPEERSVKTSGEAFGRSAGWDEFVEQADRVDTVIDSLKSMVVQGVGRDDSLDFQKGVYFRETPGKCNSYDICLGEKKGPTVIATVSYNARNKWEAVISSRLVDEKKPEKERIIYGAIPFQTELFEKIRQTTGEDVTDCMDITSGVELLRRFEPVVKSEKNIKALTDCITSDNRKYMVDKLSVQQNVKSQGIKIG